MPFGYSRAVIPHVDDLGASHGANEAFAELAARKLVTCGSVIVPGSWFCELAELACQDPSLDIGVHLTLTSEWKTCRWAPISTVNKASGLIDDDGFFWRDLASLRAHLVPEAAELEFRAQIERAYAAGIRPTHLDAHMAAAMVPELLDVHVRLGREYGLFPVLPRTIEWPPDLSCYRATIATLEQEGAPLVDHCRGTLAVAPEQLAEEWRVRLRELPAGITHLALHCTAPSDFGAMSPEHAVWRYAEYELLRSGFLNTACEELKIGIMGTRLLQSAWVSHNASASGKRAPVAD